ncbi:MAG: 4-hydroxythreonine-4-phosphate dehydrogenase PdxA [Nitrospiraceae bacterium]|nr:4-hydroxythreonine-4-phosphate dehydrogenase PdxA [Nitrospiraceae bacterium]
MRKTTKQENTKPILGITMGDPAGIGPEVIVKALAQRDIRRLCRPIVIGSLPVMEQTVRFLGLHLRLVAIHDHTSPWSTPADVPVLDPLERPLGKFQQGMAAENTGAASVAFIKTAVRLAQDCCIDGIVTGPINKEAINLAGCRCPGHTELLADLTNSKESGMMILGGPLKIMFATTHVAIRDLSQTLSTKRVEGAIRLAHRGMHEYFDVTNPRIGVAALNPHAGESGLFGDEERTTILPAVHRAQRAGIEAGDPLPADTLFVKAARGEYDSVVAMYHDQGLIPLKLMAFGRCVNLTIGLPIIRTSVDHGTAYDIVGKGLADPGSLIEAIKLASRLARKGDKLHAQRKRSRVIVD